MADLPSAGPSGLDAAHRAGDPANGGSRIHRFALPWLPLVVGPLALLGPALLRGEALFWGTPMLQFIPWRTYAKQLLLDGQLPLWNPALGMGAPLLANYQSALLYPPNWILLLLDVAWGQTVLVALHLMFAGIGMALLARQLGLNRLAQAIAGLAFGMSGYLVARAGFLSINAAAAWLPWIVLAVERLVAGDADPSRRLARLRPAAVLGLALSMQWLAGHAQLAWYSLILAAAWLIYRTLARDGRAQLPNQVAWFAAAAALALLLAGAQLVPTLEYLSVSDRSAGLDPEFAMTYSFWPWRLTGLLAPDLFGHPRDGSFWGYGNYWEDAIYLGVLPAVLAAAALLRRRGQPVRWFLATAAGLALVLALGKNTPLFPLLYEYVPSFALFQAPSRWNLLLVFSLALLAGYGAQGWGAASGRTLYWLRLGTAGAGAVVLTAALGGRLLGSIQPTFAPAIALSGALLLASGALGLTRGSRPGPAWQWLAIGLVLADMLYVGRGANPTLPSRTFEPRRAAELAAYGDHRLYLPSPVEQQIKFEQAFRFDDFQADQDWSLVRDALLPNTGLLDGLSSANNFDPIRPGRYTDWLERLEDRPQAQRAAIYRSAGVGWMADASGQYQPVAGSQRVWIAPAAEWVGDAKAALNMVFDPAFDPSRQLVLEGQPTEQTSSGLSSPQATRDSSHTSGQLSPPPTTPDRTEIVVQSSGRVDVQVEASGGGWLVLADSWYPGWQAYLDGEAVASHPANGIFRAVWVSDGGHTVSFRYEPGSVKLGLGMSLLGLVGLAVGLRRR